METTNSEKNSSVFSFIKFTKKQREECPAIAGLIDFANYSYGIALLLALKYILEEKKEKETMEEAIESYCSSAG